MALLMVLSPLAGASTTCSAPFAHTHTSPTKLHYVTASCLAQGLMYDDHWNASTGNVRGIVSGYGKSCQGVPAGYGYALVDTVELFTVLFPIAVTNGNHNVSVSTSYALTLMGKFSGSPTCAPAPKVPGQQSYHDCSYGISAFTYLQEYLYDATNGTFLYSDHSFVSGPQNNSYVADYSYCTTSGTCSWVNYSTGCNSNYSTCVPWGSKATGMTATWINTGANCLYRYAGQCYYWCNQTLNSKHRYFVDMTFEISSDTSISGYAPGRSASTEVNGATGGSTGWTVNSITVT
ncbi:MAG TPA: hypothetical protein VFF67_02440 [Thermoplasmata archaeon]|nr:hypothetical protein [Thermoplasmata archaeon]